MLRDCECGGNTICHYGKTYKTFMKIKSFLKMYVWAIKESYSFMEGSRNTLFWIKLPFKAYWIAVKSI